MVERELPEESSAQRIGQLAQLTLGARHPLTWKLKELDGTTDVGLDYQVQVVKAVVTGELNQFRDIFRLQLKGTESPKRSSDGDFYSVDLKASTVRYYERMTEPVLLVLCDLSVFPGDPRACPAFYVWIHDEIRRRRGDGSRAVDNNDYLTFRVPVANVLDGSFDVCSEIERTRTLMKVALQLDKTVEQSRPGMPPEERGAFAHKIIGGFVGRGVALLDAMSEPVSSPWPKAPQGSIAARLITVAEMLQRGNSSGAMAVLEGIRAKVSDAVAVERAEFAFLFGRALTLNGQEADALPYFDQAIALSAEPKHLVAWAEGKLRESLHGGTEGDLSAIRARLTVDHPEVIAMQARLLATEGKHTDAQAMLDRLAGDDVMTTRAIVALNASDWLRVTDICSAGLAKVGCDDRSRSLFSLLRARGLFHIAVGIKEPVEFEKLPVFGPPDLDLAKLRDCWSDIEMTLGFFSEAGWPENTDILADIWAAAATMLGLGKDQLPILKIAAAARPRMLHLQFALESVAATCNDIATALEANARLGDGAEETLRRIGLLLNARKFAACLELVEARLSTLPHDHQLFPTAICFGIVAADKIVQPDRADNLVAILEKLPNNAEHLASLKYSRAISHKGLASDDAIAALGIAWKVSQTSLGLGIQYFLALPVDTPDAAAKAIAVAQDVRKLSLLPSDAELHLAQAYVTTSNWPALLTLGEEGTARFPLQARFVAVAAFALDKLGRTAEARSMLDDLIQKSLDDSLAVHTYVRIAARSGFINDAIRVVEQIVGQEIDKRKKLGYLRMLHELVASREPQCARAEQIAWQMGQLSDHEDESEEGTFLTLYMTSTLSPQVYVPPERQTDFRRRLGDFQKRFPSSRLLSGYSMPDNPTLADLERMIASFDPGFRERHEQKQKLEKMLDRGELPIPYAWRPRLALENVSDTPTLWELAKTSQAIPQKYRLGMVGADWTPAPESSIAGRIPLLDLLALLVVHDLGLFEVLFEVFGTIAVAQGVFEELRRVTGPMTASWGRKTCLSIQAELKKRFDNVRCPTVAAKDDDDNDWSARLATDEIKKLAASGEYLLYTDDAIFRVYADVPTSFQPVFCTLDLLAIADARGLMPIERLAAAYSDLCKWNVGIVIADRYLFANIPNVVMSAKNLGDAIDVLRNDAKLGPMLNGIWDISRPYSDIHAGTARLCARWLEDVGNRIETITALIGVWHIKVKLHRDVAKMSPLDQLALMMVSAGVLVQAKTAETSRRLWKVYLEVVAFEHGNRMDEAREREAIRLLGTCMARSAFGLSTKREVLEAIADFIRSGLTEGTAVDQWYGDAYNAEWTKQALESDARARNAERHTKA